MASWGSTGGIGTLVVNLGVNVGNFTRSLGVATNAVRGFVSRSTSMVSGFARGIQGILGKAFSLPGLLAGGAVGGAVGWAAKLSSDAEQLKMQFEVLTGQGKKTFDDLQKFALRTSFSLESAGEAARNMLASGVESSQLIGTMRLLGDLSMGDGERLKLLSKAYTDVLNKGKLNAQEIRQFAENGVGLVGALANMYGKTTQEILKMSEAGEISFADMQKALQAMTSEGGRFNGMLAKMATTLKGQFDQALEQIGMVARALFDKVSPAITNALNKFNEFMDGITGQGDVFDNMMETFETGWKLILSTAKFYWTEWVADIAKILWEGIKGGMQALNPANMGFNLGADNANGNAFREMEAAQLQWNLLMTQRRQAVARNQAQGEPGLVIQAPNNAFQGLNDLLEGVIGRGQMALGGLEQFGGGLMMQGEYWWKTLQNAFDGTWQQGSRQNTDRFATAMTKGSEEAYSAIVNAGKTKDSPQVNAIKEQTKQVTKKLDELIAKPQNMWNVIEGFVGI